MRTKDESIVWQNQSHLVQKYIQDRGIKISLTDMCRITDVMMEYALKGRDKDTLNKLDAVEAYLKNTELKPINLNG